jgi:hypothetical protein
MLAGLGVYWARSDYRPKTETSGVEFRKEKLLEEIT